MYINLVPVSALLTWLFGYMLMYRHGHVKKRTTSEIALRNTESYLLFAVGLSFGALLLGAGVLKGLVPRLGMNWSFSGLFIFMTACVFVTAWVKDLPGIKHTIHLYAAWTMSYLFMPIVGILLISIRSLIGKVLISAILLAMILLHVYDKSTKLSDSRFLKLQQTYIVLFQVGLLVACYL
jgi:hypothetical protein